jgi:hypothetical protein
MKVNSEKLRKTEQIDMPPGRTISRAVWCTPLLRRLGMGMSEAAPGNNLEGDFTS